MTRFCFYSFQNYYLTLPRLGFLDLKMTEGGHFIESASILDEWNDTWHKHCLCGDVRLLVFIITLLFENYN